MRLQELLCTAGRKATVFKGAYIIIYVPGKCMRGLVDWYWLLAARVLLQSMPQPLPLAALSLEEVLADPETNRSFLEPLLREMACRTVCWPASDCPYRVNNGC